MWCTVVVIGFDDGLQYHEVCRVQRNGALGSVAVDQVDPDVTAQFRLFAGEQRQQRHSIVQHLGPFRQAPVGRRFAGRRQHQAAQQQPPDRRCHSSVLFLFTAAVVDSIDGDGTARLTPPAPLPTHHIRRSQRPATRPLPLLAGMLPGMLSVLRCFIDTPYRIKLAAR